MVCFHVDGGYRTDGRPEHPRPPSPPTPASSSPRSPGWALVALLVVAALALWLVTFDNGQLTGVLARGDLFFHEFFHDGRHLARRALSLIARRDQYELERIDGVRPFRLHAPAHHRAWRRCSSASSPGWSGPCSTRSSPSPASTTPSPSRRRGRGRPRQAVRRGRRATRGGGVGQPDRPEGRGPVPRLRADRRGVRPVPGHHLAVAAHHHRRPVPPGRSCRAWSWRGPSRWCRG